MNNDLAQFSEERLRVLSEPSGIAWSKTVVSELAALARIDLAVKQAKPVGVFVTVNEYTDTPYVSWLSSAYKLSAGNKPYTTPQPAHTEQDGWIKCSERMPEDSQWCAVNTEYGYYVQCWGSEQGWLGDEISIPNCDVTHWMPLPAAPKPESE